MVRRKNIPRSKPTAAKRNKTNVIVDKSKRTSRVLQEIRHLRRTTHFLIPKLSFARLVRDIIRDIFPRDEIARIQATALEALQEATEMYIVQFFEDAVLLALHAKRVTLMRNDMILMRRLRGRNDVINR
ncbi:histone H3.3 [Monomorium pharaonis]|uniref:histone H3.3 n=1 Tax=Monomorium pharaonis TaxID=307658 RepID=UPI00063F72A2|nr:histone H3.3 [Monomorium pharaonis]XP_036149926.1 histone H3.3 [Monomorium pharaonis]XP_036149927.1 histone H3.3 [Monomorium pharaonis]XP_036149928.1 histone H3.3 [Monomorium pharaonis]